MYWYKLALPIPFQLWTSTDEFHRMTKNFLLVRVTVDFSPSSLVTRFRYCHQRKVILSMLKVYLLILGIVASEGYLWASSGFIEDILSLEHSYCLPLEVFSVPLLYQRCPSRTKLVLISNVIISFLEWNDDQWKPKLCYSHCKRKRCYSYH